MKILFVGGGNMAQAILGGLFAKGQDARDVWVIEPHAATQQKLRASAVQVHPDINTDVCAVLTALDVIVLAVKPQMIVEALAPLMGKLDQQLVVSIAAGVRVGDVQRALGGHPYVVRTMPNTPALIRRGITGLFTGADVAPAMRARAQDLMAAVGKTVWFEDEAMLDTVTAVSGSGPAYVFYFIEALADAAEALGMSPDNARAFALETFVGSAALAASSAEAPQTLRANVTSKRGTTERAIASFDDDALKEKFIAGVKAAAARSRELGDELAAGLAEKGAR